MESRKPRRKTAYDFADRDRKPVAVWCDRHASIRIVDPEGVTVATVVRDRTDYTDNQRGKHIAYAIQKALNDGCKYELSHRGTIRSLGVWLKGRWKCPKCGHAKEISEAQTCAACSIIGVAPDELWTCPECSEVRRRCDDHYGDLLDQTLREVCGVCLLAGR